MAVVQSSNRVRNASVSSKRLKRLVWQAWNGACVRVRLGNLFPSCVVLATEPRGSIQSRASLGELVLNTLPGLLPAEGNLRATVELVAVEVLPEREA